MTLHNMQLVGIDTKKYASLLTENFTSYKITFALTKI